MPLKKVKQLIRKSAPQVPTSERDPFMADNQARVRDSAWPPSSGPVPNVFPLVAHSPATARFYEQCKAAAQAGRYVAVAGHKDDLLEAPSLFLRLADELCLASRTTIANGRESADLQHAIFLGTQALFVPTGRQLPTGVQHALADERFSGFGLLFILIAIPPDREPEKALYPDLLGRCGNRVLAWPAWSERTEDHDQLVANAIALLGMGFGLDAALDEDTRRSYTERPWKTVGHMIKSMHADIAKSVDKNGRSARVDASVSPETLN